MSLGLNETFIRATNFEKFVSEAKKKFQLHLAHRSTTFSYMDATINLAIKMEDESDFINITTNAPNPINI